MNALQGIMQGAQPASNSLPMRQPSQQASGFSGVVSYQGKQIPVNNGQGTFGGERFIVSDDGRIVANDQGRFVGIIQNGQFVMATPEITEQFRQQGAFAK